VQQESAEHAEKFMNANISQQYISGCKHGHIQELEQETVECVRQGKAIPLQAWTGLEGSRRLRLPDFKTIGT